MKLVSGCIIALLGVTLASSLSACSGDHTQRDWPSEGTFDYQLGGTYTPEAEVSLVVRDSSAEPVPGLYNVCYVNGFQTQPDETAEWLSAPEELVLRDATGAAVIDPAWPDEMVLDTSTVQKRTAIVERLESVIERCATKGFDAVEFDNLDTFTRFGSLISEEANVELARALVITAHAHGLKAGQKNTPNLAGQASEAVGFDFAIAEECHRFQECGAYIEHYGNRVLDIEYRDDLRAGVAETCSAHDRPSFTVVRDRDLLGAGEAGYYRHACARR